MSAKTDLEDACRAEWDKAGKSLEWRANYLKLSLDGRIERNGRFIRRVDRVLTLRELPDIMRWEGFFMGAQLMDRWFHNPAYKLIDGKLPEDVKLGNLPSDPYLEESMVTMAWAMQFSLVKKMMGKLRAGWLNDAGRTRLEGLLKKNPGNLQLSTAPWRFGYLNKSARALDETCQINIESNSRWSSLEHALKANDLVAALGEFTLKIAISAMVSPIDKQGNVHLKVDEYGFYIRDSYDFEDEPGKSSQKLGVWSFDGIAAPFLAYLPGSARAISTESPCLELRGSPRYQSYLVTNEDFDDYRTQTGMGGDFLIYTDVYREKLNPPLSTTVKIL